MTIRVAFYAGFFRLHGWRLTIHFQACIGNFLVLFTLSSCAYIVCRGYASINVSMAIVSLLQALEFVDSLTEIVESSI